MPVTWQYAADVLMVVAEGLDTPEEWRRALREARADSGFRPGTHLLFDGRGGLSPLTSEDLEEGLRIISAAVEQGFGPRVGVVMREVPRELFGSLFGRGTLPSEMAGLQFGAFGNREEALAWLRRSPT